MRVYGRQLNADGTKKWIQVDTDASTGSNDAVNCVWLVQAIKLIQGESPFWPSWGVPVIRSLQTQISPDTAVKNLQSNFQGYFAYLRFTKTSPGAYTVKAITLGGTAVTYVANSQLPQ